MTGVDLKSKLHFPLPTREEGCGHELWQNRFFSNHGLSAVEAFQHLCRTLPRRPEGTALQVCGIFSHHGIRSTDLSRKPSRHRYLPGGNAFEALSHGHPIECNSQQSFTGKQHSRLANLRRLRTGFNSASERPIRRSTNRRRCRRKGFRDRFFNDRSMLNTFPLGEVSQNKIGNQAPHDDRSSREHTRFRPYNTGKNARPFLFGPPRISSGRVLRYGSWLPRLWTLVHYTSIQGVLRHPCQKEHSFSKTLFQRDRSIKYRQERSNRSAGSRKFVQQVSRFASSRQLLRPGKRQTLSVLNQQCRRSGVNGCGAIQVALADRIVLQVDKTT